LDDYYTDVEGFVSVDGVDLECEAPEGECVTSNFTPNILISGSRYQGETVSFEINTNPVNGAVTSFLVDDYGEIPSMLSDDGIFVFTIPEDLPLGEQTAFIKLGSTGADVYFPLNISEPNLYLGLERGDPDSEVTFFFENRIPSSEVAFESVNGTICEDRVDN